MRRFSGFLERKDRENKHNLRVLAKILERAGFQVKDHLNHHQDPYLFIEKPIGYDPLIESLTFGGIRIYTRGSDIVTFRPQIRESAEPFGLAYLLDVTGMYKELIREANTDKVGLDLVRYVVEEVLHYFVQSAKQQSEDEEDKVVDSMGRIVNGGVGGTDYANQATSLDASRRP